MLIYFLSSKQSSTSDEAMQPQIFFCVDTVSSSDANEPTGFSKAFLAIVTGDAPLLYIMYAAIAPAAKVITANNVCTLDRPMYSLPGLFIVGTNTSSGRCMTSPRSGLHAIDNKAKVLVLCYCDEAE